MCWNAGFSPSLKCIFIFFNSKETMLIAKLKIFDFRTTERVFFDEYFYVTLCQLKTSDNICSGSHRCFQTAMTQDEEMRDWDCSNTLLFSFWSFFSYSFSSVLIFLKVMYKTINIKIVWAFGNKRQFSVSKADNKVFLILSYLIKLI